MEKQFWIRGGRGLNHGFASKIFSPAVPKEFVRNSSMFQEVSGVENFMDRRGRPLFFHRKSFVSQCRKISCGKHLFQRKSGTEKQLWERGGGYHVFLSEIFLSHIDKKDRGEPFNVSESLWYAKIYLIKMGGGREFDTFPWKLFSLTLPKNFVGEFFRVSVMLWYQKKFWILGVSRFCQKRLFPSAEKILG